MPDQNLSGFDSIGSVPPPPSPSAVPAVLSKMPTKRPQPADPKKVAFGCLFIVGVVFLLLIVAMVGGLAAGDSVIQSFGFDPASFKRWAVGLVYFVFGALALVFIIAATVQLVRFLLADRGAVEIRRRAVRGSVIYFILLLVVIAGWVTTSVYLQRFLNVEDNLPVEIVTNPTNPIGLTSPITVGFSAELITRHFAYKYMPLAYEWDQNADGIVDATGEKVQLYFPNAGKNNGLYDVSLAVRLQPLDGSSEIMTQTYHRSVSIASQKMYGEIVADRETGEAPMHVQLDGSQIKNPNGQIINYRWTFDDDTAPKFDGPMYARVDYEFTTVGAHKVALTLVSSEFDATGTKHLEETITKTINVQEAVGMQNADALISADPKSGTAPLTVRFDASQSGVVAKQPIERYEWVVGDGLDRFFGVTATKTFDKPGAYPVLLKVYYTSGQTRSDTVTITVVDKTVAPTAVISTDPMPAESQRFLAGPAPFAVTFSGTKSKSKKQNIVKYEWDFDGDGAFDADGSTAKWIFQKEGKYVTTLRVTDSDGLTSEATLSSVVGAELPRVSFGASTVSGPAPLTVDFDASASRLPGRKIVSYEWNFDTNDTSTANQPYLVDRAQTTHIFPVPGEYIVSLTLHADDGATANNVMKIVATHAGLVAKFTASRTTGVAPLAVSFDAAPSTGEIAGYAWTFGDGQTSTEPTLVHVFEKAGTYTVRLTIGDSYNNISKYEQQIVVK